MKNIFIRDISCFIIIWKFAPSMFLTIDFLIFLFFLKKSEMIELKLFFYNSD